MNWTIFWESIPALLQGCVINVYIAFFAFIIGITLAIPLALMERSSSFTLKSIALTYNTIFRGTPMLIQIFFGYYGLPLLGVTLPPLFVVIVTIGLNSGAYCSQIILAGLSAIPKDQFYAAKALSMSSYQSYRHVILPQCFRKMIPAGANEMINLLKDSSLASIVGIHEIVKVGTLIRGRTYETFAIFLGTAIIYISLTSLLSLCTKKAEKWSEKPCSV